MGPTTSIGLVIFSSLFVVYRHHSQVQSLQALEKKKINQNEIKEQLYFHEIKTSDFLGIFLNLFVKYFGFHIILRV